MKCTAAAAVLHPVTDRRQSLRRRASLRSESDPTPGRGPRGGELLRRSRAPVRPGRRTPSQDSEMCLLDWLQPQ
eukprot:621839-Hanusia_phi.AAC.1